MWQEALRRLCQQGKLGCLVRMPNSERTWGSQLMDPGMGWAPKMDNSMLQASACPNIRTDLLSIGRW
eukprot:993672-Amphidinium_carterae.2